MVVNKLSFGVHCPSGKCLFWLPDNSKCIANLPSYREWGTICNFFNLFPEIMCCWCAPSCRSILHQVQWPPYHPSSFSSCSLSSSVFFFCNFLLLSPFLLLTCCVLFIHKNICTSGNQLWKLYVQITWMCQFVKPYIFVYTVGSMFLLDTNYCAMSIIACTGQLYIWCDMDMTDSFSNICYPNTCCAVGLFQ